MLDVGPLVGPDELELAASYICASVYMYVRKEPNSKLGSTLPSILCYVVLYYCIDVHGPINGL